MGRSMIVGLLAFAVALAGTAYAEVQNIRVSGDIDLKAVSHQNYDLKATQLNFSGQEGATDGPTSSNDDDERFFLSTVHLQVDADLTDNVSASVKLLNQRKWDAQSATATVHIDNAYIVLRDFLYSPLTIIAGRQNLTYGNQFIVGDGLLADPESVFADDTGADNTGTQLIGNEYSAFNAFDAIRLILDFAPITVEGVLAKVNDTGIADVDADLYGVVVNYKLDQWDAEVEPYWFFKRDESGAAGSTITVNDASTMALGTSLTARTYETNEVHTVGLRVGANPIEGLHLRGEGAHQFGTLEDTASAAVQERDRDAWGAEVYANYTWSQVPWTPATGVGWVFYSGEEAANEGSTSGIARGDSSDDFNAWDPVYRGEFHTYIQDFFAGQDASLNLYQTIDDNDTASTTNRHLLYFDVEATPLEDLTLWARYTHVWFDEAPRPGRDSSVGDELDVKATYDYTEDVELGVFGGWFIPGSYYDGEADSVIEADAIAWTVGGGASVTF